MRDDLMTHAAALAFYTLFSLAPLTLIVMGTIGMLLGAPARVRLDSEGTITAEAMEVVGTWHFEGDLVGAFGFRGVN
ncbi:MAG: hypothetical protein JSV80_08485, partial [Acidobacteriota bacterium]